MRRDRENGNSDRRGGGVLIATNKNIRTQLISSQSFGASDFLLILCKFNNYVFYVCCLYAPPNSDIATYTSIFDYLDSILKDGDPILLAGDFNLPFFPAVMCDISSSLMHFLCFNNLVQVNSVYNFLGRRLDLVISNINNLAIQKCVSSLIVEDNYHPSLRIDFSVKTTDVKKINSVYTYDYSKGNYLLLHSMMRDVNWDSLLNISNPNDCMSELYCKLYNVLDKTIPKKISSKSFHKRKFPHWFSKDLIKKINIKNKMHRRNKFSIEFRDLRTSIKAQTKVEFREYHKNIEHNASLDPSGFWKFIKSKSQGNGVPEHIIHNDTSYEGSLDIANAFANYFKGVYEPSEIDVYSDFGDFWGNFDFVEITNDMTLAAIKKLKSKKSVSTDNIPSYIFKGCAEILAKPLTHLFNCALNTGVFPDTLKKSIVVPIYKKGGIDKIQNYRPINLLSPLAKVFEIILHENLQLLINEHIVKEQHGFLKDRSTISNLSVFTNSASLAIDNKQQLDVIYTDAEKAFDKVSHKLLLNKLIHFGLSKKAFELLKSYLTDRTCTVRIGNETSDAFTVTSGVPQGSNISPLLFILFVNDLPECIMHSECLLFADDFKIYKNVASESDCIDLQSDLTNVMTWFTNNKMFLNIEKCSFVSFTRKSTRINFEYRIHSETLTESRAIKDLGITFESNLRFNLHYRNMVNKAYQMLGFLIRNSKHFKQISTLSKLYNCLVRPHLEYASIIWTPTAECNRDLIEKIQKKFLRYLYFKQNGVYPVFPLLVSYKNMLSSFNFQDLHARRIVQCLIILYNIINNYKLNNSDLINNIKFHVPKISLRRTTNSNKTFNIYTVSSYMCHILDECNAVLSQFNIDIFHTNVKEINKILNHTSFTTVK